MSGNNAYRWGEGHSADANHANQNQASDFRGIGSWDANQPDPNQQQHHADQANPANPNQRANPPADGNNHHHDHRVCFDNDHNNNDNNDEAPMLQAMLNETSQAPWNPLRMQRRE
ncbi:hypothetical protein VTN77DRAFT_2181 [Rasamsonia byssochlamydoides]|uniref:uncharacterized protein n=1 Tax=Rasamsonia byssochlamydoides TaxID=89139 RepID=UPI0037421710